MKNFALILTLLAAFAVAGCGDDKPASAPAKVPASSSSAQEGITSGNTTDNYSVKKDFIMTKLTKEKIKEKNVQIVNQYIKGNTLITKFSDGTKNYESAKKADLYQYGGQSKLDHFKPAN